MTRDFKLRLAVAILLVAVSRPPHTASASTQTDTEVQQTGDSVIVVLRWGPEETPGESTGPRLEIRWNHNDEILKIDTVTGFADSVIVPVPPVGKPDTIVVALWPVSEGPPVLRRLEVLDGTNTSSGQEGVRGALILDSRGRGVFATGQLPATGTGAETIFMDFNDPNRLELDCGGDPCSFPDRPWRKHDYAATGGIEGTGAMRMHWQTGMTIEYSPVWIHAANTHHFKLRYSVRQSAVMRHQGSAVKLLRIRSGNNLVGTLESKHGEFVWFWDGWYEGAAVMASPVGARVFSDNQWHVYEIEVDYRSIRGLVVRFAFDGISARALRRSATRDLMTGPLIISPFVEMYSCGPPNCGASVSTGDYVVDDFSITILD